MKTKVALIMLALAGLSVITSCGGDSKKENKAASESTVANKYACPMHPEVTSDQPGTCSKCGMDLVEQKSE